MFRTRSMLLSLLAPAAAAADATADPDPDPVADDDTGGGALVTSAVPGGGADVIPPEVFAAAARAALDGATAPGTCAAPAAAIRTSPGCFDFAISPARMESPERPRMEAAAVEMRAQSSDLWFGQDV